MKFSGHIAVSPVLLLLTPFIGLSNALIAIASSILIDLDHIHLVIAERAFSIPKLKYITDHIYDGLINGKPNRAYVDIIYLFHTVEFNLLLLALSLKIGWLKYIALGFIFHILCDILHHRKHKFPIIRWLFLTDWIRFKLTQKDF